MGLNGAQRNSGQKKEVFVLRRQETAQTGNKVCW